jgi:hypothetical protein
MDSAQVQTEMDSFAADESIKVMFLSMGAAAAAVTSNEANGLYFEAAVSSDEILGKLTTICNRIFERNVLPVEGVRGKLSFDIPMKELMVFAQGADVDVGNISGDADANPESKVSVRYSEIAALNYANDPQVIVSDDLNGIVALYKNLPKGSFTLDVSGARSLDVFYKPDVTIGFKLYNDTDNEVTGQEKLVSGAYNIEFGFVNEENAFINSQLLGDVSYLALLDNNGTQMECTSGDSVTIEPGDLTVDVEALLLKYNTVRTTMRYQVLKSTQSLEIEPIYPPEGYSLKGMKSDPGLEIVLKLTQEGKPLTQEQWNSMELPVVKTEAQVELKVGKGDEVSTFVIKPSLYKGDVFATTHGIVAAKATCELLYDEQLSQGEKYLSFTIADNVSLMERLLDWLKNYWKLLLLIIIAIILLIGYTIGKKRLPRSIKTPYNIEAKSRKKLENHPGHMTKNKRTVYLPFVAEEAKLLIVPKGVTGVAALHVRAIEGGRVEVLNTNSYIDKQIDLDQKGELKKKDADDLKRRLKKNRLEMALTNTTVKKTIDEITWTYTASYKVKHT